ncbi:hypothetical protein Goklo_017367, partial [Gossypium klotzschianum]|nr:hypothetical protein [Gossypium klotzschianum]
MISSFPFNLQQEGEAVQGTSSEVSRGLSMVATVNCMNKMGAKNLYIISVKGINGCLNTLPLACVGDMVMATVKKGKPDLRKK